MIRFDSDRGIYIVNNSPIEFVLVGPKGARDGVIMSSQNAKLDLVGYGLEGIENSESSSFNFYPFSSLFYDPSSERRYQSVVSNYDMYRRFSKYDFPEEREVSYKFCWIGYSSERGIERIKNILDTYLSIILDSIQKEDYPIAEELLSNIIFNCVRSDSAVKSRAKQKRISYITFFGLYILVGIIFIVAYFIFGFMKR